MEKISVVIITFNEERNIARCLAAVREVADDIVVVDAYSTDGTKTICEQYGARVFQRQWTNYSDQKNFGNSQAYFDWILSVDADEALSPQLISDILQRKRSFQGHFYKINRLTNYCGRWIRHCGWYPDSKVRLFDRRRAKWQGDYIHEKLVLDGYKTQRCPQLSGDCYHFSYYTISEHIEKTSRYSALAAESLRKAGVKFSSFKAVSRPLFKFFRIYLLQLGFLDGYRGFTIALLSAYGVFLKYAMLHPRWQQTEEVSPLRILHIDSERTWRGGEQQVSYLLTGLAAYGMEQHVACRRNSALHKFCLDKKIPHLTLPFYNQLDFLSAFKLMRYCSINNVTLLHLHSGHAHSIAIIAHILGNRVPIILSRRVAFPIGRNPFSLFKYNHKAISRIVCVSNAVRETLQSVLRDPSKCETVYSSIDASKYSSTSPSSSFRSEFRIPTGSKLIGNIGALTAEKDHATFLKTAKILSTDPNLHFVIVGDGPLRAKLQRYAAALDLGKRVTFTGSRNDVPAILPCFDVLLFTSRAEGCPNAIIEAFAAGIPVIATDAPGTTELVINEVTGLLAPAGNAQALAYATKCCAKDPALRRKLVTNALDSVSKFSTREMVERTSRIYNQVLAELAA